MKRRKTPLPRWRYSFDCRRCDNIREIHDSSKGLDGDYCTAFLNRRDKGLGSPIHTDEQTRIVRCECFVAIAEVETEANNEP